MLIASLISVDFVKDVIASVSSPNNASDHTGIVEVLPAGFDHAVGFIILTLLAFQPKKKTTATIGVLVVTAVLFEVIQPLSGFRLFDITDIPFNLLGVALGVGVKNVIHFWSDKTKARRPAPARP